MRQREGVRPAATWPERAATRRADTRRANTRRAAVAAAVGLMVLTLLLAGPAVGADGGPGGGAAAGADVVANPTTPRPLNAHGDPEPLVVTEGVVYDIAPGPGWPPGWTPPEPPAELDLAVVERIQREWEFAGTQDPPKHIEMRVLPFMPEWTNEYPYVWLSRRFRCGDTGYQYYIPFPDQDLMLEVYGDGHMVYAGPFGGPDCTVIPVTRINPILATPEENEQMRLRLHLDGDKRFARLEHVYPGGLRSCQAYFSNGTPDNIHVCFNTGNASERFDVPAYLDVQAARVRVPVRFVSEMMGAQVHWDEATGTVTMHFPEISREIAWPVSEPGDGPEDWIPPGEYGHLFLHFKLALRTVTQPARTIVLTVGQPVAAVDGVEVPIDAPPVVRNGRTMVPVRFISEQLGAKVYWVGDEPIWDGDDGEPRSGRYQVHIFTRFYPFYDYPSWFLETRAVRS